MRLLSRLFYGLVFLVFLSFALKNTDLVAVRYFFGLEWRTPLIVALLLFFGVGMVLGRLVGIGANMRQRREILALKRELRGSSRPLPVPATPEAMV